MNLNDLMYNPSLHFEAIDSHVEKNKPGQHEIMVGEHHIKVTHRSDYKCPLCGMEGIPKLDGVAIHLNVLLGPLESITEFRHFLGSVTALAEFYGYDIHITERIIKNG